MQNPLRPTPHHILLLFRRATRTHRLQNHRNREQIFKIATEFAELCSETCDGVVYDSGEAVFGPGDVVKGGDGGGEAGAADFEAEDVGCLEDVWGVSFS